MTVLELVKAAAYEAGWNVPSGLASATDLSTLQQINLFYATGRELRKFGWWAQLKKRHTFFLESGRRSYPLPLDFYAAIPQTHWDGANTWEMRGPMSDSGWNYREYGYVTVENRRAYRVFGPDTNPNSGQGQLQIDPTPGDGDAGAQITFEYVSKSWLQPPLWTASSSVTSGNYRSCAGNNYTAGSTTTSGTVPMNMRSGVGRDGGATWRAISASAWGSGTLYKAGDYVTNGGYLYQCTVGGTSAGSGGPTGTGSSDITDNTVTWLYRAVDSWTGQTSVEEGDHLLISAQYYKCLEAGKTGSVQPTWSATTVSDGAITWTYKSEAYESIVTDNDLCLFDDDLMILGLKWRFLRAKGAGYTDIKEEYERAKNVAITRYNSGRRLSLSGEEGDGGVTLPFVPEGSFEF